MARGSLVLPVVLVAWLLSGCPSSSPPSSDATIEFFTASAVSVSPGTSVTLSWRVVNTVSCSLQNTVVGGSSSAAAPVSCVGSEVVSPSASTTYRLSALKRDGVSYVWVDVLVDVGAVVDSYPYGDAVMLTDEPATLVLDGAHVVVPAVREGALASLETALVSEPIGVVTPLPGLTRVLALRFSGELDFVGPDDGGAPVLRLGLQPLDVGVSSVAASGLDGASVAALVWVRVGGEAWVPLIGMARWDAVAAEYRVSAAHVFEMCADASEPEAVPVSCELAWQVVDVGALVAAEDAIETAGVVGGVSRASTMPTATGMYRVNLDAFVAAGASCDIDRLAAFLIHENERASWVRSARTAVVFVHGWQSLAGLMQHLDGDEPFALPAHCSNWESFLSGIAGASGPWASLREYADVFTFRYNSNLRVAHNGLVLAEWLPELQTLGYERVQLVAHSMGGLVAHDARERVFLDGRSGLTTVDVPVVTLATPYMGGPLLCTEVLGGFCQAADTSLLTGIWGIVPIAGMPSTLDLSTALHVSALQRAWMGHRHWLGFALPYERNPYLLQLWEPVNMRDPSLTAFVGSSASLPGFFSPFYEGAGLVLLPGWGVNDGIVPLASGRAAIDLAYINPSGRIANGIEYGRDHGYMISGCGDHVPRQFAPQCPAGAWTDDVYLDAVAERMLAYTLIGDGDITVVVVPESATLVPGGSQHFTASVRGTANTGVSWSSTCGTIGGSGNTITFTAPATPTACTLTATSMVDTTASGSAVITVVRESSGVAFVSISTRAAHTLALDDSGRVWAWGSNSDGQIGDGTMTDRLSPAQVVMPPGTGFTQVAAGQVTSWAIDQDGAAWGWGWNGNRWLGSDRTHESMPVRVGMPPGVTFTEITAGGNHVLAVDQFGRGWAWGQNGAGELGDGTQDTSGVPVRVSMPTDAVFSRVAAGDYFSFAVDQNGQGWAWGWNGDGQLGDGGITDFSTVPVRVDMPANTAFATIASGNWSHAVAIDQEGRGWAWGRDYSGELGDGSRNWHDSPVAVLMPSGVAFNHVAAGGNHSLAVDQEGSAWAWGWNAFGQLGEGSTLDRATPVPVDMPAGVAFTSIVTGWERSFGIDQHGTAWAWGAGLLGNGVDVGSSEPVQIRVP